MMGKYSVNNQVVLSTENIPTLYFRNKCIPREQQGKTLISKSWLLFANLRALSLIASISFTYPALMKCHRQNNANKMLPELCYDYETYFLNSGLFFLRQDFENVDSFPPQKEKEKKKRKKE